MDGYQACDILFEYLNDYQGPLDCSSPLVGDLCIRKFKTLIYSLSSDYSPDTLDRIKQHPFDDYFFELGLDQIRKIFSDIENMKKELNPLYSSFSR